MDLIIQGVGRFSQPAKFTFDKGYNVITGPNESGKTTVSRAILATFYPELSAQTPDFVNWQLEGNSRCYLNIREGNDVYRIVRDFTQNLSNLSKYVPDKKAFGLVSKDANEIKNFLFGGLKLYDFEIYSTVFYSDFNNLPSTHPHGIIGFAPKAPVKQSKTTEKGDSDNSEFEGMDIDRLKGRFESLKKAVANTKEVEQLQSQIDREQERIWEIQSDIKEIDTLEKELQNITNSLDRFRSFGDLNVLKAKIDKFSENEMRATGKINELKSVRGQAEAELYNIIIPPLTDNKFFITGLGILGVCVVVQLFLGKLIIKFVPSLGEYLSYSGYGIFIGLAVAGAGAWQYFEKISYKGKLKRTVVRSEEQINQMQTRLDAEIRDVKQLMKSIGAENMEDLKSRIEKVKQFESRKESLESKITDLKIQKKYERIITELPEIERKVAALNQRLESSGALGFSGHDMVSEIKRIESYLAKKGVAITRFEAGGSGSGPSSGEFGMMAPASRFPEDHIARFLAIAAELIQKGQMEPLETLQNNFNKYIQLLTNKGYVRASFSTDGAMKFFKSDNLMRIGMENMSPATKDCMYFALKFALIESLIKKRTLPVILDNPFSLFDDDRMKVVSSILKSFSKTTQVVHLASRQSTVEGADRTFKIK